MSKAAIKEITVYLPDMVICNEEIEQRINKAKIVLKPGTLEKLSGTKTRRFAGKDEQVSDLACKAALKILNKQNTPSIDFLIFAAASSDLLEPATANIVQAKLGLQCPVMDIKNACNSVVSAVQVASAFIEANMYKNILIVSGEKLSEVINYNPKDNHHLLRCFAGYSLGDAGAAILMSRGGDGGEICYQKFRSWGQHWELCTVLGGGSIAYREMDKYYFEGDASKLKDIFSDKVGGFINECMRESGWRIEDIDCLISHQVSCKTTLSIAAVVGIPADKCIHTFSKYGNIAAATIPVALYKALEEGKIKRGDKLMVVGLAAGINISVQLIKW